MAPLLLFLLFLQAYPSFSEPTHICRNSYEKGRIIDITHRITPELVSWGSGGFGLGQFLWLKKSIKKGDNANSSFMKLSVHTGTHVDAPGHFIDSYFDAGFDVDNLDLNVLNGNNSRLSKRFTRIYVNRLFTSHGIFISNRAWIVN